MRIEPFKGYRFGIDRVRDVSQVVAPPYDQISPEIQDRLYAMHPHNIVRVSYPRDEPGPARSPTSTSALGERSSGGCVRAGGSATTESRSTLTRRPTAWAAAR